MKKILLIMVIMSLLLVSVASANGRIGVAVCVPGYAGNDCIQSDCYGVMTQDLYTTLEECENVHNQDRAQALVSEYFVEKNLSVEQLNSFIDEIHAKVVQESISVEEATELFKQEREQIKIQMEEQMKGSLADDRVVVNSFERQNNFSLEKVNVTLYSMKDIELDQVETMKQVANTFQERNNYQYQNFEMLPINEDNSMIILQRQSKFLIFDVQIKDKYIVDNFGSVVEEKRSFWSYIVGRK